MTSQIGRPATSRDVTAGESVPAPVPVQSQPPANVLLRLGLDNDAFGPSPQPEKRLWGSGDNGITGTFYGHLGFEHGLHSMGIDATYRLLTEKKGERRTDEAILKLSYGRTFYFPHFNLQATAFGGGVLSGDLGGATLQDSFHRCTNTGRTLDGTDTRFRKKLQGTYAPNMLGSAVLGGDLALRVPWSFIRGTAGVRGQLAIGDTGISSFTPYAELALSVPLQQGAVELGGGIEGNRMSTPDPMLTLAGGYNTDHWFSTPYAELAVPFGNFSLTTHFRFNEGGGGNNIGKLSASWKIPVNLL